MQIHQLLLSIMIFPLLAHRALGAPGNGATTARSSDDNISAILSDLSQLNTDLDTMDANVKVFTGSLRGVLVITLNEARVEQDLDRVTDDMRRSSSFDDKESDELVNAIVVLDPVVVDLLHDVVAKKPQFESVGILSFVVRQVTTLQGKSDAFLDALKANVHQHGSKGDVHRTEEVSAHLNVAFHDALAALG